MRHYCPAAAWMKLRFFCVYICHVTNSSLSAAPAEWRECPEYSRETPHQCFFNEEHTTVWTQYAVQLRSGDGAVVYDEVFFNVQDIGEFLVHTKLSSQALSPLTVSFC